MEKKVDTVGYLGLGISAVGAIATIATNSIIPLSIGSTIGVGCNLFSRKQLNDTLVDAYQAQEQKIESLTEELITNKNELEANLTSAKTELGNKLEEFKLQLQYQLAQQKNQLLEEVSRLDLQHQQLSDLVSSLQQIENLSQKLRVNPEDNHSSSEMVAGSELFG